MSRVTPPIVMYAATDAQACAAHVDRSLTPAHPFLCFVAPGGNFSLGRSRIWKVVWEEVVDQFVDERSGFSVDCVERTTLRSTLQNCCIWMRIQVAFPA
jgi:hypothetical protein